EALVDVARVVVFRRKRPAMPGMPARREPEADARAAFAQLRASEVRVDAGQEADGDGAVRVEAARVERRGREPVRAVIHGGHHAGPSRRSAATAPSTPDASSGHRSAAGTAPGSSRPRAGT